MNIAGKVIVITGAARGLGRAMALDLAARGARLALIDMDQDGLDSTRQQCQQQDVEVRDYRANIVNEDAVENLFNTVVSDFGSIHGLINNAGITRDGLLIKAEEGDEGRKIVSKMSLAQWQAVIDVNLTGVFLCGREAASHMIELGVDEGVIINISSIARAGNFGQSNYSAAKAGVAAMATTWAKELARYNIRAAAIAPGVIETDMVRQMPESALNKMKSVVPLARMGKPEHIAQTVAFILENDYVSGRVFEIDGAFRL